uniref:Uncharacterized protein n=1 Tax=Emiliania huxleyi TaxID=2903 RepID=A0A6V2SFR6_EMIHU
MGKISLALGVMHFHVACRSRQSFVSPAGSSDAAWSVPFQVRSLVKCRSFHCAPIAYAATSTAMPRWWPEKPIALTRAWYLSYSSRSSSRHTSSKGTCSQAVA